MSIITALASTAAQVEELSGGAVVDKHESGSTPFFIAVAVLVVVFLALFFTVNDGSRDFEAAFMSLIFAAILSMVAIPVTNIFLGKESSDSMKGLDADSLALFQSDLALNGITVGDKSLATAITEEATSVTVVRDGEIEHMSLFVLKGEGDYTVTWSLDPQTKQAEQAEG